MEAIDVIILAGGEGKRLRSIVGDFPKPLAEVGGRPFLDILLDQLKKSNCVQRLVLAVGYKAEKIIARYENSFVYNFDILFSIEEKLLGTAGAIKKAMGYITTDTFLAMNGDSYTEFDLTSLIKAHIAHSAKLTVVLVKVQDASRYGSVKIDAQNKITSFEEKKQINEPGLINSGIYMMQKDIFRGIEENGVISMEKELLPTLIKRMKGSIYGYIADGKFIDIGVPQTYRTASKYLENIGR